MRLWQSVPTISPDSTLTKRPMKKVIRQGNRSDPRHNRVIRTVKRGMKKVIRQGNRYDPRH